MFCVLVSLIILFMSACKPEIKDDRKWYKGNLHTHSFWSDGDDFPEMIMDWYKTHGYHFLALSDHNILAEGEKWIGMAEDTMYRNAFARYVEKYGEDWVKYKEDSGRLSILLKTLEEYRPLFEEKGRFLIMQSEELTDRFEDKHIHMNATNIEELIEPQGGNSVVEVLQNNINAVLEQRRRTGRASIVHINHPNFHYSISLQDMIDLHGERFFEVFNGHNMVHNEGDDEHISTEEMWDQVNIAYLQLGKPLIFGLATDDSHHYHRIGKEWSNAGRGWIMVRADTLSPDALIGSMEAGDFYGSTGVTLEELRYDGKKLYVKVATEPGVNYEMQLIGCMNDEEKTSIIMKTSETELSYSLPEDLQFVRCKIVSDKVHENPIENLIYETAWTQPFQYNQE